jgi:O-antigen/teichoic acid export membrane protein
VAITLPSASLRANAIANFVGQLSVALVSLFFVPLYIQYIGVESYGVIGFFAALQAMFSVLDFGLGATLNRQVAILSATTPARLANTVRTLEWVYMPCSLLIAISTLLMSGWFAENWVRPSTLSVADVSDGIALLGLATALQWPALFHTAGIAGLQRQILLNVLKVAFALAGALGCLLVLMAVPTLQAYASWQALVATVQSIIFALIFWRILPTSKVAPRFRLEELKHNWRFAGGILAGTLVSLVLTQADKVVLSRALSLEAFGHYSIAAALAAVLYRLSQPILNAAGPRYSQLAAANETSDLARQYHLTNQVMALVLIPPAVLGALFSSEIVLAWSRNQELTNSVAPIFQILVLSAGMHSLMNLPYALQLAHGWVRLSLYINLASIAIVVPLFVYLGTRFGGVGAAYAWLALTTVYVLLGVPLMHRRLLPGEARRWYLHDIAPPLVASVAIGGISAAVLDTIPMARLSWAALCLIYLVSVGASATLSPDLRRLIRRFVERRRFDWKST